jgi:signal-transduction protein with cAMP-binding, CBS, and nucleotidyltransferase domain
MEGDDVGSLPVVEMRDVARLIGVLTDRDIALRVVAAGRDPQTTPVGEVASRDVITVTPDDDLDDALTRMARAQVRRLPVVVGDGELVGMLSQADLPRATKEKNVGEIVGAISRPPRGPRVSGGDLAETDPADASGRTSRPSDAEPPTDEQSRHEI